MGSVLGVLFGFGVATFLWLPLAPRFTFPVSAHGARGYFLVLGVTLLCVPLLASVGGTVAAYTLSALIAWGGLALLTLVASDLSLAVLGAVRWLRRPTFPRVPA